MYNNINDNSHYEYFDYLDDDMNILQYEPDSDMDFIEFKKIIKNEWVLHKSLFSHGGSGSGGGSGSNRGNGDDRGDGDNTGSRWCGW